jgi:hypothetical protein
MFKKYYIHTFIIKGVWCNSYNDMSPAMVFEKINKIDSRSVYVSSTRISEKEFNELDFQLSIKLTNE